MMREVFEGSMLGMIQAASDGDNDQLRRDEEYRKKVLEAFFEHGRLKSIPAQRKKERICLGKWRRRLKLA